MRSRALADQLSAKTGNISSSSKHQVSRKTPRKSAVVSRHSHALRVSTTDRVREPLLYRIVPGKNAVIDERSDGSSSQPLARRRNMDLTLRHVAAVILFKNGFIIFNDNNRRAWVILLRDPTGDLTINFGHVLLLCYATMGC